jgi:cob(I)alamin adenosyltransferase
MTSLLPPLKNFILPGGSSSASALHTSRAVCRRIERKIVDFVETNPDEISDEILPFINRLSDFLFVSARYVNMKNNSKDVLVNV